MDYFTGVAGVGGRSCNNTMAPGRIVILDFVYISRKFPDDRGFFPKKTKKYLHRHPVDCSGCILRE